MWLVSLWHHGEVPLIGKLTAMVSGSNCSFNQQGPAPMYKFNFVPPDGHGTGANKHVRGKWELVN
jgi:hypothetical protein